MKALTVVLLCIVYSVQCGRKAYPPIDKNANLAFINMESGGVRPPPVKPSVPAQSPASPPTNPASPTPAPTPKPQATVPATIKPAATTIIAPKPVQPVHPTPVKPIGPTLVVNPITTPGPGSVKHLINFYDSRGNASVTRPFSYSQAVKNG